MNRLHDSYDHYRTHVGCGRLYAAYRALHYELLGREPKKYRSALEIDDLAVMNESPRQAERREEYESWVRCLDVELAAGDLDEISYEAEKHRYAKLYGIR